MINACELTGWLYNLQMIETIVGNEEVGKLEMCNHGFFCSLDMQLFWVRHNYKPSCIQLQYIEYYNYWDIEDKHEQWPFLKIYIHVQFKKRQSICHNVTSKYFVQDSLEDGKYFGISNP